MRLFLPVRRATLAIPSGSVGDPNREHLHILLTDPVGVDREILLVSVSTVKAGLPHDPTCYLYAGDHAFIRHRSYVLYALAQIKTEQKVVNGIRTGDFRGLETMPDEVMARILQGVDDSPHTKPRIKTFLASSRV